MSGPPTEKKKHAFKCVACGYVTHLLVSEFSKIKILNDGTNELTAICRNCGKKIVKRP